MKWRIQSLFPTALFVDKLDFKLNKKQLKYTKTCERKQNTFNISSSNSYVLNYNRAVLEEINNNYNAAYNYYLKAELLAFNKGIVLKEIRESVDRLKQIRKSFL